MSENKTGTYKWINGECVKVSDRVPSVPAVYFPRRGHKHVHHGELFCPHVAHGGKWFKSRREKEQFLKDHHLKEAG